MRQHVLPDVLVPDLKIVFCGTAAGSKSAAVGAYYAGPGNRFWATLNEVGLTPREFAPREFRGLIDHGIGFTDLAKHTSGSDAVLRSEDFDPAGFRARMEKFSPRAVAFNGKRAAGVFLGGSAVNYGRQPASLAGSAVFVLPSTSGAARGFWDLSYWHALAAFVV